MHAVEVGIPVEEITAAAVRIGPFVRRTPVVPWPDEGFDLWLKAESLQVTGAFKARGATNAVMKLADDVAARGVLTHSSGNHAAAVARAAKLRGVAAHVVMPENAAAVKVENVRRLGVEPRRCGANPAERQKLADAVQAETGATLVHPYNDPDVMAGQGTVGLEILEQVPDVAEIIVPVGGGGLTSGILSWVKACKPTVRVIAAEPAWADDTARSLAAGRIEPPLRHDTIADGLRSGLGTRTFPILQQLLDDIVLVDEAEILRATRLAAESGKLVVEPSGAVALAAAVRRQPASGPIVAVITGGNIDFHACRLGRPPTDHA
ncbi:MAG: pyridoxal-phosphate dependent enzyme [Planctomycetota bacterium]